MSAGLLARMGSGGVQGVARVEDACAAITEHLRVLLQARPGGAASSVGFGLSDLADAVHSYPAGAQRIAGRIRGVIEMFEPRLARGIAVDLLAVDEGLQLTYRVSARLQSDRRVLLAFRVDVAPDGVHVQAL